MSMATACLHLGYIESTVPLVFLWCSLGVPLVMLYHWYIIGLSLVYRSKGDGKEMEGRSIGVA